ncbi:hypothetical protein PCYB_032500 [Plasmodium cynomolgi strain B]|uniref:Uncharacterized protein n=1 Tax=Plasmodium cynomolgi (strain B) TaxID=1120755 RepID=K6UIA0_PLACD|nr:hypothetical protein PCYB_032500 [Plasmodium cynomolgi strain B]GAB64838.1 hypothetical protein PCYB_032500 [Plasmodium cynomolgi strain B]
MGISLVRRLLRRLPKWMIHLLPRQPGENLFCLAYGRKITVLEHSSHITVRKQFMINHSVQLLRSVRDNILVTYGEKELHVFQLVYVKKEFSLVFFFKKGVRDAKCWKIHDGGNTFEVYEDAIKVNVKLIKINRDDEVARRIFYATNGGATKGGATKGGAPKGDATNGGATNGGATNGDTSHGGMALGDASIAPIGSTGAGAAGGAAHFYVNLLYIYVLDGERVDLVVVNSLVYLIYLLFSHHRYGLLLALMLHLYRGNCCVLTDLPVDEDERRDKLKPLIYFLFERRMNDIIKNGNKFGSNPRNSIYHVQVKDRQCDEDEEVKRRNGSNGFNNWCNHTSNKVLESVQAMGQSSESTFSASADQSMSESVSVALNGASFIDEEENGTEWPLSSHGGITSHGEGNPGGEELQHESRQILIDGRVISGNCIRELQKLCLLGIEISINFHMDLHECIFQFLRGVAAENFYFHLIEEYIVSKRIGITHDSVVFSLTEYFKRLYRIFSEYDDSCYDVFLFFCSLVGEPLNEERPNGERLNGKLLNGELLNEELLSEVVFSPLGESGDSSDEGVDGSGGEGGDERDCEGGEDPYDERDCERGEDPCADLDMHLYRHHLGAKNISRKIRRIYAFVCIVELFFRLFESISLEGEIEGIISHLPIHLSAFIYNKHNEDRITTAEFFISYLIRKKSNLFYSFCRCNSLRSDELPIYLPMYMFRNFYHCYFLFDYVFSVTFKVPFSISLNRFAVPLEEGITLRSCHSNVQAKYQFDDILNYGNIFFIFSPFRVERENHCTLNRTILSLWRYLLDGTHSRVGVSSVVGGSGVGVGSGVGGGSGVGVGSGADGGNSLEFLSPRRRSGDEGTCRRRNDPQRTQMNDYFNLDKNGFFLLLQLSLKDTFYLLNRSFFQYDYINNYDVINLLVRNLCNFYLHMVIIFLHYRMYLKKTLMQNLLEEETCVCIYGEVLLAVNTCRQYNEVSEVCLRLVHLIEEEGRHMHVHKNISNIVRWITLQLFYINKHREEMANSITYSLILFFILQSGCDDYSFDYLMGVHFVNFLLRLPCGGCQERRMSSTTGRRRFEKLTRRCFLFANKNYLKKIRPHVREERLFEAFRLKETNLRIRESQIKKNVEGTSSPQGNLVDYLLGEVYGVDVPGLLRQHGGDGGSGGDGGVTRPVRRGDGCAFKRVRSRSRGSVLPGGTSTGGSVPSGRVPSGGGPPRAGKTNKEQKQGDIFCVKFCRRHYGYILLLYVKKLLVLHRGGRSPGGEKREEESPPKVHSKTAHHRLRRKNVEKLLKYILFFSSMRKCEPVYVIILNHFGRYDVVLDHYRTRKEWRSMEEYIFGNIFFLKRKK